MLHPVCRGVPGRPEPNSATQKLEAARSSETSKHPTRRNNREEFLGNPMAQGVSRLCLTTETRILSQACLCGICGGQGHTLTGFSVNPSVFHGLFTHAFIHHRRYVWLLTDSVAK